jgi:hypothetical protein
MKKINIKNLFSDWGKKQQNFSGNNENAKLQVMNSLNVKNREAETKVKRKVFPLLMKFGVGFSAIILVSYFSIVFLLGKPRSQETYTAGYQLPVNNQSSATKSSGLQTISASDLGIEYNPGLGSNDINDMRETRLGIIMQKIGLIDATDESSAPQSASSIGSETATIEDNLYGSYEPIYGGGGYPYPYPNQDVNYTDTREYLKVFYQTTIKSRAVDTLAGRIQTIIRGYGGRVDSASANKKYAYISFIVPKKLYEAFRTELKGLVGERFIDEYVSSQNYLPQKVSIEDNTKTASSTLVDYQTEKKNLTDKHNKTIADYQKQVNYYSSQVWSLQQEYKNTTSTSKQATLQSQINYANSEWSRYKKLIESENSDYNKKSKVIDSKIKSVQNQLAGLKTQDTNLTNNVETVQGSITIQWVSVWQMFKLYVPFYGWLIAGIILLVIVGAIYGRRRSIEVV